MIRVTVIRRNDSLAGFRSEGHAGYADEGYDIICAAVSALMINCVNSVEKYTRDRVVADEHSGYLSCSFPDGLSADGELLVNSMLDGLEMISGTTDRDGKPFLQIVFEED
jgi:uncharacterized protein YsxB (DUF464 family)